MGQRGQEIKNGLEKSIVLVGLMGSGKSSVGRRLAEDLGVEFADVDEEIVKASSLTIAEIFEQYGEAEFRALETRVLERMLGETPKVIATGGGVFVNDANREMINNGAISVYLDGDLDTLWERVRHKSHRPLLNQDNPKQVLADLLDERRRFYEEAQFRVPTYLEQTHEDMVERIKSVTGLNSEQ